MNSERRLTEALEKGENTGLEVGATRRLSRTRRQIAQYPATGPPRCFTTAFIQGCANLSKAKRPLRR